MRVPHDNKATAYKTEELMMSTFQFVAIFCMLLAIFMGEGWA